MLLPILVLRDIYLIIEVSDSTLDYDRYTKIPLYAEANIKEVWIINLKEECLEVYRHPLQGSYQATQKYYRGESIFMESFPDIEIHYRRNFRSLDERRT